ncbi:hypothetical protein D3C81_1443220 [compost metagenome]
MLEVRFTTVIGIGHHRTLGNAGPGQPQHGPVTGFSGSQLLGFDQVLTVSAEDMVEMQEILGDQRARPQPGDIHPMPLGAGHGTTIRRITGMPAGGTGRIDLHPARQTRFGEPRAQRALAHRRAADIAQADHQQLHCAPFISASARSRSSGVSMPGGNGAGDRATAMRCPASSTRNCSSDSICSSVPGGIAANCCRKPAR